MRLLKPLHVEGSVDPIQQISIIDLSTFFRRLHSVRIFRLMEPLRPLHTNFFRSKDHYIRVVSTVKISITFVVCLYRIGNFPMRQWFTKKFFNFFG
jgi:hypothetical protein